MIVGPRGDNETIEACIARERLDQTDCGVSRAIDGWMNMERKVAI